MIVRKGKVEIGNYDSKEGFIMAMVKRRTSRRKKRQRSRPSRQSSIEGRRKPMGALEGKTVVIIHGWSDDWESMKKVGLPLKAEGAEVHYANYDSRED